jgi:hypothetical protein
MRSFPSRDVRDLNDPVPENHFQSFASGSSFVLGPGYQVIEALPGQPHDGSPPVSSNPQAAVASPFAASETSQSAVAASSPLASISPSGSQQVPSVEPAPSTSALPSGLSSAQVSLLSYHSFTDARIYSIHRPPLRQRAHFCCRLH